MLTEAVEWIWGMDLVREDTERRRTNSTSKVNLTRSRTDYGIRFSSWGYPTTLDRVWPRGETQRDHGRNMQHGLTRGDAQWAKMETSWGNPTRSWMEYGASLINFEWLFIDIRLSVTSWGNRNHGVNMEHIFS